MTQVREVPAGELAVVSELPFVRHQVDPAATLRAWMRDRAAVVESSRLRPGQVGAAPHGRGRVVRARPAGVGLRRRGHWMLTAQPCPEPALQVEEITEAGEVDAVLDLADPLGVYVDNAPALAIYHGLGCAPAHTFSPGPVKSES